MINPDIAQSLKIITRKGSTRIAKFAFDYARKHGRKKIHAIHKANIMKLSDGLFLDCCKQVAAELPRDRPTPSTSSTTPACSSS